MLDIIKTLKRLPNFGYVFFSDNGPESFVVLGGHLPENADNYEWKRSIISTSYSMQEIYKQHDLSAAEKCELVRLMQKMYSLCETRTVGSFDIKKQEKYLEERSEAELKQIEQQVKMHLDCQQFYRVYF